MGDGAGAGPGEYDGTASRVGVEAGVGADGTGVQLAPSINSNTKRIIAAFIIMPTVQNMPTGIISHHVTALQGVITAIRRRGKKFTGALQCKF